MPLKTLTFEFKLGWGQRPMKKVHKGIWELNILFLKPHLITLFVSKTGGERVIFISAIAHSAIVHITWELIQHNLKPRMTLAIIKTCPRYVLFLTKATKIGDANIAMLPTPCVKPRHCFS